MVSFLSFGVDDMMTHDYIDMVMQYILKFEILIFEVLQSMIYVYLGRLSGVLSDIHWY